MRHALLLLALATAQGLHAQAGDPAALLRDLKTRAVTAFTAAAAAFQAQSQYGRALQLRTELLQEYDEDNAAVREAIGHVRAGAVWRRDMQKAVIEQDQKADAGKIRRCEQDWDKAQKELGKEHEKVAAACNAAGDTAGEAYHLRRALRFRPGDQELLKKLQLQQFEGFTGSERELQLLRRSVALRSAVEWLRQMPVPMQKLGKEQNAVLQKAGVAHTGLRTEHFTFWGAMPPGQLEAAAEYAERTLLLCRTLFGTGGRRWQPDQVRDMAFFADRATYARVLDACKDQFADQKRFEFLRNEVDLCFVADGRATLRVFVTKRSLDEVLDQAVRAVAQDATMFRPGLWEGIGHTSCGLLFGKTISFLIERPTGRTVTNFQPRPLLPEIGAWMQIAAESAWCKTDTPAGRLVLIDPSRFTTEERVKAWAMTDYLVRTRPELLYELNQSHTDSTNSPPEVEAEFQKRTKLALGEVEAGWREYWARMQAVRDAVKTWPHGKKDEIEGARALAAAVNAARAAADQGPLGFVVAGSPDTAAAHKYFADLAAAEAELANPKRDPKKEVVLPTLPAAFDRTLLVARGQDPAAAVLGWLTAPGARDQLLHPGRQLLGCSKGKQACVVELTEPMVPFTGGAPWTFPRDGQVQVPSVAKVQDLGGVLVERLGQQGKKPTDTVGFPLSVHFARLLDERQLAMVSARVMCDGGEVEGLVVPLQGDGDRRGHGDGVVAFVPLHGLPDGSEVTVDWLLPAKILKQNQKQLRVKFTVAGK